MTLSRTNRHAITRSVALAAALLLAACAAPQRTPTTQSTPATWQDTLAMSGWQIGHEVEVVTGFAMRSFETLDDEHLVVHLGAQRRVLVTAGPGCFALDQARRIAWSSFGSRLHRLDQLHALAPGLPPSSCRVESIHQLRPLTTG